VLEKLSSSYMLSFIIIPDKNLSDDTFACISTEILGSKQWLKLHNFVTIQYISMKIGK